MSEHELFWDLRKAAANLEKHGVSFEEAASSLDDRLAIVRADHDHSEFENRFVLIGESDEGRLLTVVFVVRGEAARIISARRSTRAERRIYMEDKPMIHDAPLDKNTMLDDYGHLGGWTRSTFHFRRTASLVSLDEDVAAVFRTPEEVNEALRILIAEGRVPSKPPRG